MLKNEAGIESREQELDMGNNSSNLPQTTEKFYKMWTRCLKYENVMVVSLFNHISFPKVITGHLTISSFNKSEF